MAKYQVSIPAPSAKRMKAYGKLLITLHCGFDGDTLIQWDNTPTIFPIPENSSTMEFEVEDKFEWVHSNKVIDGWSFDVCCEYSNSTKTRTETKKLVPQKL